MSLRSFHMARNRELAPAVELVNRHVTAKRAFQRVRVVETGQAHGRALFLEAIRQARNLPFGTTHGEIAEQEKDVTARRGRDIARQRRYFATRHRRHFAAWRDCCIIRGGDVHARVDWRFTSVIVMEDWLPHWHVGRC